MLAVCISQLAHAPDMRVSYPTHTPHSGDNIAVCWPFTTSHCILQTYLHMDFSWNIAIFTLGNCIDLSRNAPLSPSSPRHGLRRPPSNKGHPAGPNQLAKYVNHRVLVVYAYNEEHLDSVQRFDDN